MEDAQPRRSARSSRPPEPRTTAGSSSTSSSEPALVEAGRVGRPHGLDGSFYVNASAPRLLPLGGRVVVGEHEARIERRAGTDERPILRLEGHSGREAAEALRGALLQIPLEDAPPLEEGEYWAHELEGCAVWDGPRAVGVVRRMALLPSCEVLEVEREDGSELLVPLVGDAVRAVDVPAKRIEVDLEFLGEA